MESRTILKLKKLKWKNFLSTGNNFTEIDLDSTRTSLIVGANGSGKSTMVDALSYGLFGKPHRSIKKGQLLNSINEKDLVVEVEFEIGSTKYKVVRGQKPIKFEIWQDGILLNQDSHSKKYQKILEQNILKHNYKTFHQVEVLGSSSFVPFMQLTKWVRREVIEELLDAVILSRMNVLLKERNNNLKDRVTENAHDLALVQTKKESQKEHIKKIKSITSSFISEKKSEAKEIQKKIKAMRKEQDAIVMGDLESLKKEHKSVLDKQQKMSSYVSQFKRTIRESNEQKEFYKINDMCPTCSQPMDGELKEHQHNHLDKVISEHERYISESQEFMNGYDKKQAELESIIDQEEEKLLQFGQLRSSIRMQEERLEQIDREIEKFKEEDNSIAEAEESLEVLKEQMEDLVKQKLDLADEKEYNLIVLELLKDTGIKTKIIKQYLPVINKLVNHYLQVLDFYVHFELDEEFNETIRSRHRDSFSYDSFSEGEKQRIDLALLFTWRQIAKMKNSVSTNLLILDETFDSSLDVEGVDNLTKILDTLGEETNVFVISHKQEVMGDKFDRTLTFSKKKNFSTYTEA